MLKLANKAACVGNVQVIQWALDDNPNRIFCVTFVILLRGRMDRLVCRTRFMSTPLCSC